MKSLLARRKRTPAQIVHESRMAALEAPLPEVAVAPGWDWSKERSHVKETVADATGAIAVNNRAKLEEIAPKAIAEAAESTQLKYIRFDDVGPGVPDA